MAADIEFLKRNGMYEQYKKFNRITKLNEFVNYSTPLEEEGEDDQQGGQDPMGGAPQGGGDPMGGAPMGGQDPNAGGQDPMGGAPQGGEDPMGGAPMGGQDPMGGEDPMGGGMPGPEGGDPMMGDPMGGGMPGEEDDVIDVDDLTKAQEKTNSKVNTIGKDVEGMDDKFAALIGKIDSLTQQLDANNREIENFKAEFNKRNPTPKEKLEQRAKSSFPFSQTVDDYWSKNTPDNYTTGGDEEEKVYEIELDGNDDIDELDDKTIERSFVVPESLKYDIKRIFSE